MNKFAFFFPAKIVFAESPVELTPYEGKYPVYLGPIGRKYYFKTDKAKIVFEHIEDDKRQLFVKVKDCFCPFHVTFIDNIPALMENINATCDAKMTEWEAAIDNPSAYEQKAAETREKIKAERAIADKEQETRKAERERNAQTVYENGLKSFINGEKISWNYFERACKENEIKIPIQTIGFGRKHITGIALDSMSTIGKHNSPVVWEMVRKLQEKLAPKEII